MYFSRFDRKPFQPSHLHTCWHFCKRHSPLTIHDRDSFLTPFFEMPPRIMHWSGLKELVNIIYVAFRLGALIMVRQLWLGYNLQRLIQGYQVWHCISLTGLKGTAGSVRSTEYQIYMVMVKKWSCVGLSGSFNTSFVCFVTTNTAVKRPKL